MNPNKKMLLYCMTVAAINTIVKAFLHPHAELLMKRTTPGVGYTYFLPDAVHVNKLMPLLESDSKVKQKNRPAPGNRPVLVTVSRPVNERQSFRASHDADMHCSIRDENPVVPIPRFCFAGRLEQYDIYIKVMESPLQTPLYNIPQLRQHHQISPAVYHMVEHLCHYLWSHGLHVVDYADNAFLAWSDGILLVDFSYVYELEKDEANAIQGAMQTLYSSRRKQLDPHAIDIWNITRGVPGHSYRLAGHLNSKNRLEAALSDHALLRVLLKDAQAYGKRRDSPAVGSRRRGGYAERLMVGSAKKRTTPGVKLRQIKFLSGDEKSKWHPRHRHQHSAWTNPVRFGNPKSGIKPGGFPGGKMNSPPVASVLAPGPQNVGGNIAHAIEPHRVVINSALANGLPDVRQNVRVHTDGAVSEANNNRTKILQTVWGKLKNALPSNTVPESINSLMDALGVVPQINHEMRRHPKGKEPDESDEEYCDTISNIVFDKIMALLRNTSGENRSSIAPASGSRNPKTRDNNNNNTRSPGLTINNNNNTQTIYNNARSDLTQNNNNTSSIRSENIRNLRKSPK